MKILVVDDEKLLVKGITFNLQNEGYEVEAAYDGISAVELVRRGDFDLVILDWMMPEKIRQRGVHGDPHLFRRAGHHAHRQK